MTSQTRITRHNHYVPRWYQKGFMIGPSNKLQYLDLDPSKIKLPNGDTISAKELNTRSTKRCFQEKDLYTTRFGSSPNDEVERFLFGEIDSNGAIAVRAFAGNDQRLTHDNFLRFFEYLDAQKLRTPKGLDWIKKRYPSLTQNDLMLEMQHIRKMHCTMWFECVREIVSAEKSDVKFIVTDHPVTVYNSACATTSSFCLYPDDPSIRYKGTQTVFVLDAEHCLILTNLEYAQDPTGVDPMAPRTNARYFGNTLTRTDAMIRARILTRDEVVTINALLKRRSRQYLAAYEESWLFPDQIRTISWEDIGRILLPPHDMLGGFGGEIFVVNNDDSTRYQDEFGRTDKSHEYLKKKDVRTGPLPNDQCGCGSGRRFKKCCISTATEDRPPWEIYSIRDRNLMFCDAVVDILGLNKGKTWVDVRRELSNDQVKRIHEMMEMLWPQDTNIADLLPRPDTRVFRAVYMGPIDPRTIALSVISSLAYFDEVVVLNPFPNPIYMNPDYSPTHSPAQHKSQMLKNVRVLLVLQQFINAGIVHLVPNPAGFNADFQRFSKAIIEKHMVNSNPTKEEMQTLEVLAEDDFERLTLRSQKDRLTQKIRESQPGVGLEQLKRKNKHIEEKLVSDPLALLQPIIDEKNGGELQAFNSMNLELALFFAHLTGAAIYTDEPYYWRQLHEHTCTTKNKR